MKTERITAVPKLRFPEFKGDVSWCEKKLIDVANKNVKWSFIGGPFGSNLKASDYTSKGIRVIQLQNIGDGEFVDDSKIYTSKEKADELLANNIYPHDIIMSKMGDPVGRACLIPDTHSRYVMCSDGIRLVVDEEKYSKYFVYSFINSDTFRASVESKSTGSTRKRIGLSHLKSLSLLIPKLPEQQKIADCLSSLDMLIKAEMEQLDTLEDHKTGLLQQLFPAEGETTPKHRFAEFEGDGDWNIEKLGDVCKFQQGIQVGIELQSKTPKQDHVRFIRIENYTQQSQDFRYVPNNLVRDKFILKNEVAIVRYGATAGFIGRGLEGVLANNLFKVTPIEKFLDSDYLYVFLKSANVYEFFQSEMTGAAMPALSFGIVGALNIAVPNLEEQRKIASFVSSLDNLIGSQTKKIKILKQHKQGLMQQLFPVMKH